MPSTSYPSLLFNFHLSLRPRATEFTKATPCGGFFSLWTVCQMHYWMLANVWNQLHHLIRLEQRRVCWGLAWNWLATSFGPLQPNMVLPRLISLQLDQRNSSSCRGHSAQKRLRLFSAKRFKMCIFYREFLSKLLSCSHLAVCDYIEVRILRQLCTDWLVSWLHFKCYWKKPTSIVRKVLITFKTHSNGLVGEGIYKYA